MASWSYDTLILGRPHEISPCIASQQSTALEMLSKLAFDPMGEHSPFHMTHVGFFGPALIMNSNGHYGAVPKLTNESHAWFEQGVIIFDSFMDDRYLCTITINGEQVFRKDVDVFAEADPDAEALYSPPQWLEFQGRTPQEVEFFQSLKTAYEARREREVVERELTRMRLQRQGKLPPRSTHDQG